MYFVVQVTVTDHHRGVSGKRLTNHTPLHSLWRMATSIDTSGKYINILETQ